MSWSLELQDPNTHECIHINDKHFMFGPNICFGGSDRLSFDITYNYGKMYRKVRFHPHDIYGKTGMEAIPILQDAIKKLKELDNEEETRKILEEDKEAREKIRKEYEDGKLSETTFSLLYDNERSPNDYWFPSPEHSITALECLVELSEMALDGVWEGD